MKFDDIVHVAYVCGSSGTSRYKETFPITWHIFTTLVGLAQSELSDKGVIRNVPIQGQIIIRMLRAHEDLPLMCAKSLTAGIHQHPLTFTHPVGAIAFSKESFDDAKLACYEAILFGK